jgi:hypothetical protein
MKKPGSGAGSGSVMSETYGSTDLDPCQDLTDPKHWFLKITEIIPR